MPSVSSACLVRLGATRRVASCFARSLLTSRPNNACDLTRYAEIPRTERRDVWHGAARTNGSYIRRRRTVNCSSSLPGPERVRGSLTNRTPGNRDRVTRCPVVAVINMFMILLYFILKTWLISLGCRIEYSSPEQMLLFLRGILLQDIYLNANVWTLRQSQAICWSLSEVSIFDIYF